MNHHKPTQKSTLHLNTSQSTSLHPLEIQHHLIANTPESSSEIPETPPSNHQNHSQNRNHSTESPRTSPSFFVYPENIVDEGVNACKRSILGKIITEKPIHTSSIQNGLDSIWGSPQGLKVQEIEEGILQFFIHRPIDQERILLGNPWIFRNSWLIMKAWDRAVDPRLVDFTHAPVWIQLWGLPPHCKTKKMGESIGNLLGKFENAEFYEYPGKKMIIKIKVAIKVEKPIKTGLLIGNHRDGTTWIDFRYEKLPQVCFGCGILGHGDTLCQNEPLNGEDVAPLGPWIQSNQYGRRIMEEKDRKYHSNPSMSKTYGKYSPSIPESMLAQMEAMKLQEEQQAEGSRFTQSYQQTQHPTAPTWHRAPRPNALQSEPMETSPSPSLQNVVKRPRLETTMEEGTNTKLAGPAQQASQI
ncbi:hypothetical protein P8452_46512 [Trifolium repens]|nr:hypothetical protein P8452_46512 [Trifolium repens]